jgi:hypothetical protein
MDCDEPRLAPNEKTQPIQWTERSTGALVAAGSLWQRKIRTRKIELYKLLDPTTETKRGNFRRYYAWSRALVLHAWVGHGTMGLKCVNLPPILLRG